MHVCKFLPDRTKQKLISSLFKIHISKLIPILLQLFFKMFVFVLLSAK